MFFNNNLNIYSNKIPLTMVEPFFHTYPNNLPSYFEKMPIHFNKDNPLSHTVKRCSGMINNFKRSVLYTSPFQIEVNFYKDGSWKSWTGSSQWMQPITEHDSRQLLSWTGTTKYKLLLKFSFQLFAQCNYPVVYTNPWWHMNDFETIPGVLECKYPTQLNIFIPIPKDMTKLKIKQGQALAQLWTESSKPCKLKYCKGKVDPAVRNGVDYIFSTLSLKVLKRKFWK